MKFIASFILHPKILQEVWKNFSVTCYPDDKKIVQDHAAEALAGKKPYSIDHRIVLPDGAIRWVHEEGKVDFDGAGQPVRMLGTVQDLTRIGRLRKRSGSQSKDCAI